MDFNLLAMEFEKTLKNPEQGLPDEVFNLVASVTPMVNVDLLVQDETGRILFAWRDDGIYDKGWHIPGGIIRFKETFADRILKTAVNELGAEVTFERSPLAVNEIITPQQKRGHFISFLYKCKLPQGYEIDNSGKREIDAGYLMWHDHVPGDMVIGQTVYLKLLKNLLMLK